MIDRILRRFGYVKASSLPMKDYTVHYRREPAGMLYSIDATLRSGQRVTGDLRPAMPSVSF